MERGSSNTGTYKLDLWSVILLFVLVIILILFIFLYDHGLDGVTSGKILNLREGDT